jgi:hypothetical protein
MSLVTINNQSSYLAFCCVLLSFALNTEHTMPGSDQAAMIVPYVESDVDTQC